MDNNFDIIVVGGGHAGSEASFAAARLGKKTLLITMSKSKISSMPCNPSIGGIAKSHLVFELDALGGQIAETTDFSGLQFRTLNTRRGPAVQANRAQCDKYIFSKHNVANAESLNNLTILEDEVVSLIIEGNDILKGVTTAKGLHIYSKAVILTTGTFLRGTIHIGHETVYGGGNGQPASNILADQLRKLNLNHSRLKTGTPPRFIPSTIDYSKMIKQDGDYPIPLFSAKYRKIYNSKQNMFHVEHSTINDSTKEMFHVEHFKNVWDEENCQIPCYLSHTTEETHRIIKDNLKNSALYGGDISGVGARYCPSIEDKVVKFSDKSSHHIFIEPESRNPLLDLAYPNGLSCSLPKDVQIKMAHSVPGLENVEFKDFAYAIEYDFYDPRDLYHSLESKLIHGLFFAGQINGTTGYEEAAAQGFMAGVNASKFINNESPLIFTRDEAYIGVMIDDLTTKGTNEPYRMFTSRAERRLLLRQSNARYRLLKFAKDLNIVKKEFLEESEENKKIIDSEISRLDNEKYHGQSLATILCKQDSSYDNIPGSIKSLENDVKSEIELNIRYRGYIEHENRMAIQTKKSEVIKIPKNIDYMSISTLRYEAREKLSKIMPENIGEASRIPGVNPADIAMLAIEIKKLNTKKD